MYTAKEQAEHRKQWVAAMRSNKYEQGIEKLRDGDKFSCLGVACDISGLGVWIETREHGMVYSVNTPIETEMENEELPQSVMDWLGLMDSNATIYEEIWLQFIDGTSYINESLSECNDNGYTFSEIIDLIERGALVLA